MSLSHLSTDAVVMYGYVSYRGAEFQNITDGRNNTAAIIYDCGEDFFVRPLPGEEISVSDFLLLNCLHETVVHSGVTSFLFIR